MSVAILHNVLDNLMDLVDGNGFQNHGVSSSSDELPHVIGQGVAGDAYDQIAEARCPNTPSGIYTIL